MTISDPARRLLGVAAAKGALTGALATEQDLPIAGYDEHNAEDIASRLKGFTQRELRTIDAYERKRENRATIIDRVAKLLGEQPWAGYDEQSVDAVTSRLNEVDTETARLVRRYERDHKDRVGVIQAAERRIDRS
jgi:hypothetical protein